MKLSTPLCPDLIGLIVMSVSTKASAGSRRRGGALGAYSTRRPSLSGLPTTTSGLPSRLRANSFTLTT